MMMVVLLKTHSDSFKCGVIMVMVKAMTDGDIFLAFFVRPIFFSEVDGDGDVDENSQ